MSAVYLEHEVFVRNFRRQKHPAGHSKFLQNAKESGNSKLSLCHDSPPYFDLKPEDLIPQSEEVQTAKSLWSKVVLPADQVLIF